MNSRWTTGPVVAGVVLGSLFVACGAQPGEGTIGEASVPEGRADATAPVEALVVAPATPRKRPLRADGMPAGVKPYRVRTAPPVALDEEAPATDDAGHRFHVDTVTPTCTNPKLTYFGGPIIQSPIIVPVFWNSTVNAGLVANMGQFYNDLMNSSYWGWLQEYDTVGLASPTTEQVILPGTATPGSTLVPATCPAGSGAGCKLTDAEIQTEINRQIGLGVLPAPVVDCTGNTRTIYMVNFPPNVSLTGPSGAGRSCANNGFCAYHNTGTYGTSGIPLVYGALMDEYSGGCASGCGGNANALENSTDTASHELIEAVTDADIGLDLQNNYAAPAAWGDNNNSCGEIADICDSGGAGDTITVSGRTWTVQEVWSNKQGKCTSTGTDVPVCTGTTLTNCRKCSCGDNGGACTGATGVCETGTTNVLFGACEQCTSTNDTACTGGTCTQSPTPTADDVCSTACFPVTSCPAGENCGTVSNGCGGTLNCGTCTAPQTCGAAGTPNVCGCVPVTACPAGDNCGTVPNGCGGTLNCGTCTAPQTCGAAGTPNVCGCVPVTACPAGDDCGTVSNGCGGTLNCGTCTAPQTCGGTGTPNVCGTACVPLAACPAGDNCGIVSNGCGGTLNCGTCTAPQTCGGTGTPNVCGQACIPLTLCPVGDNCGTVSNGCGGTLNCGTCTAPQTCGGAGVANQCGAACVPFTTCQGGANCGIGGDGCGGTLNCGTCNAPETCGGGGAANQCGCTPINACPTGQTCGSAPDSCGGTISCGTCSATQTCNMANQCVTIAVDAGHDSGSTTNDAGQTNDAGIANDAGQTSDSGAADASRDALADGKTSSDATGGVDANTGGNDASSVHDSGNDDAHHAQDSGSASHDAAPRDDAMASAGDASAADGGNDSGSTGGCGCRTTQTTQVPARSGLLLLIPLALIGRRRQRRRAERAG